MFDPILLPDRGVLAITGADAHRLLQDLVTANMAKLTPDAPIYGGLLTPQGKFLFDFIIHADGEGFLFDMARSQIAGFVKRMTLYKLRSDMTLAPRDDLGVQIGTGAPDPRHPDLPPRALVPAGEGGDPGAYHRLRITLGIPETGDFASDGTFWLETGAERMGGVDFKKGCYVGQEQTARMKHRGTVKKGYRPFRIIDGHVGVGDEIEGSRPLGPITTLQDDLALGFVRLGPFAESESFTTESACLDPLPLDTGGLP